MNIFHAGDTVQIRHPMPQGTCTYLAEVIGRNDSIIGPGAPFYTVTGCSYPLPHTSVFEREQTLYKGIGKPPCSCISTQQYGNLWSYQCTCKNAGYQDIAAAWCRAINNTATPVGERTATLLRAQGVTNDNIL